MIATVALLLACALAIYSACEAFVNGIEWVGRKLNVSQTATGTILAAFGTGLPESVVTIVATAFGVREAQKQIGIGAALGGPLVLSTISYAVVGIVLLCNRHRLKRGSIPLIEVDGKRLSRDQGWFLVIFVCMGGLGLVTFAFKPWLGLLLLAAYGLYVWKELRGRDQEVEEEGELEPLLIRRGTADPGLGWAAAQTTVALVVIFAASRMFVGQIETVGTWAGMTPQLTALLLSPIATELPETMNALIWVRQGKERLALANISGAMMIQATVPAAFGLLFTPWLLDKPLLIAAAVTVVATAFLFVAFRIGRVSGMKIAQVGWLYAVFATAVALLR